MEDFAWIKQEAEPDEAGLPIVRQKGAKKKKCGNSQTGKEIFLSKAEREMFNKLSTGELI